MPGKSPDDLIFAAYIEDKTEEFFDLFDKNVDKSAQMAEDGFGKVDDALGATEAAMGGTTEAFRTGVASIDDVLVLLEGSIGGVSVATLALSAAVVAAFVLAAAAVAKLSYEMSLLAAPTGEAISAMEHLATIHGIGADAAHEASDTLESFGASSEAAARSVVELIRAEIDLADTQALAARAANLSATTGEDFTSVLAGMTNAIKENNTEALEQYDIFLNQEQVMEDYAKSIDKPVESLSELDKRQAILNATLADADRHLGAYEDSAGTVTRQSDDLSRGINELKVAFGLAFQDAHAEVLAYLNEKLQEMIRWVEENRETIVDWATVVGNVLIAILKTVEKLAAGLIWLFGIPKRLARGTQEAILKAFNIPEDEIQARIDGVGVAFRQMVAIILGAIKTAIDTVMIFVNNSIDAVVTLSKAVGAALSGNLDEALTLFEEMGERARERLGDGDFFGQMGDTFSQNVAEMGDLLNVMEDVETEAGNVEAAFAGMGDAASTLNDTLDEATRAFGDLYEQYQNEIARAAVQETRKMIEQQLRTSHRMQDIQRNYNRAIKNALEGAQEDRRKAIEGHNEQRVDILRDYHRRVQDIQQDFNRNAHELARNRDAVGLMELIRANKYKLEEEKESRDERLSDQDRLFQRELKHIERRKQEEIEAINERRNAEIENLKRSLERQRELEALHRQWQIEDRQEKYRQRLEDMVEHYVNEEKLTYEHLQNLLKQFYKYFEGLAKMTAEASKRGFVSGDVVTPAALRGGAGGRMGGRGGVIGQGGLVSTMLPPVRAFDVPKDLGRGVPDIPTTHPGGEGGSRRDINVKVSGDALDPIIQRELVRSLLEIERNRS